MQVVFFIWNQYVEVSVSLVSYFLYSHLIPHSIPFFFREMQSTTVLLYVFICMTTLYITKADKNQCMCVCCKDGNCKSNFQWFSLQDCTDQKCAAYCPSQYPSDCGAGTTTDQSMCMDDPSSSSPGPTPSSFSRQTASGVFTLACVFTAIFRIWL